MGDSPRYRHWITKANEGLWPTAILCVDCCSEAYSLVGADRIQRQRLTSWHGVMMSRRDGEYRTSAHTSGESAPSCLEMIAGLSATEPVLWVVSWQCQRVWPLLGVWEGIENGTVQIQGTDYRNSQAQRERLREYRRGQDRPLRPLGGGEVSRFAPQDSGYMVCENPPNILRGRFLGTGHSATWVDIRNHGIDPPTDLMPGMQTSKWLANVVARMCRLSLDNRLTALKPTAGSQAIAAWRHSHLEEPVYVHTDTRVLDLESRGYFGGRCEAITLGIVRYPVQHIDYRSQYGWVCANCPLPTRLLDYTDCPGGADSSVLRDVSSSIAEVTISTDEPAYPVRRNGEVIYPIGRYRTVLCGPELSDAVTNGRVTAVHAVAVYGMGYPLRDYAKELYLLRCLEEVEGIPETAGWFKRLIVSLPGKLGQLNHRWIDCPNVMPQTMYGEWYGQGVEGELLRYRSLGGLVQRDVVEGFAADSVPSIAAFVTSYGRMRLLGSIRRAGWEHVHYYDTDSLMVDSVGYARLASSEYMASDGMGYLTVRGRDVSLEVRGIKYYVEQGKVTCSGLHRGQIVDAGDGVHYTRHLSPVELARKGQRPEAMAVQERYARAEAYTQRVALPDGRTRPIELRE